MANINPQTKNFCLVSYLPVKFIQDILTTKKDLIRCYAYITHNMDIDTNGNIKTSHTHIIISLWKKQYLNTIKNWFNVPNLVDVNGLPFNTLGQKCISLVDSYEYLTHKNDSDKYQYNEADIVSYNFDLTRLDTDNSTQIIEDLLNDVPLKIMMSRYGRDFILNYKKYTDFKSALVSDNAKRQALSSDSVIVNPFEDFLDL